MKHFFISAAMLSISIATFAQTTTIQLVRELNPSGDANPRFMTEYNQKFYFSATNGSKGHELFFSDGGGSIFNTNILTDIYTGVDSSDPKNFKVFKNKLFFTARDNFQNDELWVTDGSPANTKQFVDINPNGSSNPAASIQYSNRLYFRASDGINGSEVWSVDGINPEATMLMAQNGGINAGAGASQPDNFFIFDDKLYFTANNGVQGDELWTTNGNSNTTGTYLVRDINPGSDGSNASYFFRFKNKVYFNATSAGRGSELWVTDGTGSGTKLFKDILQGSFSSNPNEFFVFGDKFLFSANDGTNGKELWVSDGTEDGTTMLKDINPTGDSFPANFIKLNNKVFFRASESSNSSLWVTDGTSEGTRKISDDIRGFRFPVVYHDRVFFFASVPGQLDFQIWSIGENEDLLLHVPINVALSNSLGETQELFLFEDSLFYMAKYNPNGNELYKLKYTGPTMDASQEEPMKATKIYPNPVKDVVNISSTKAVTAVDIYSMAGQKVLSQAKPTSNQINVTTLASGIYFLHITYENNDRETHKIIKN